MFENSVIQAVDMEAEGRVVVEFGEVDRPVDYCRDLGHGMAARFGW